MKNKLMNFILGKKKGWTPIGKQIDKLDFLYFLPNEHRISILKLLICIFIILIGSSSFVSHHNTNSNTPTNVLFNITGHEVKHYSNTGEAYINLEGTYTPHKNMSDLNAFHNLRYIIYYNNGTRVNANSFSKHNWDDHLEANIEYLIEALMSPIKDYDNVEKIEILNENKIIYTIKRGD